MVEILYVSGGPRVQTYHDISFQMGMWQPAGDAALAPPRFLMILDRAKDPTHFQVRFSDDEKRVMEAAGFKDDPKGYTLSRIAQKSAKVFEAAQFVAVRPPDPVRLAEQKRLEDAARERVAKEEAELDVLPPDTPEDATYYCNNCGNEHIARTYIGRKHYAFKGMAPAPDAAPASSPQKEPLAPSAGKAGVKGRK